MRTRLRSLLVSANGGSAFVAVLAAFSGAGNAGKSAVTAPSKSSALFSAEVVTDAVIGLQAVVLRYSGGEEPGKSIEVKVAPGGGANLYSLKFGGEELLLQPKQAAD